MKLEKNWICTFRAEDFKMSADQKQKLDSCQVIQKAHLAFGLVSFKK
jgi:hypothetical protein